MSRVDDDASQGLHVHRVPPTRRLSSVPHQCHPRRPSNPTHRSRRRRRHYAIYPNSRAHPQLPIAVLQCTSTHASTAAYLRSAPGTLRRRCTNRLAGAINQFPTGFDAMRAIATLFFHDVQHHLVYGFYCIFFSFASLMISCLSANRGSLCIWVRFLFPSPLGPWRAIASLIGRSIVIVMC